MSELLENKEWTEWRSFPAPRSKDFICAPFGCGVYQLQNVKTNEYVLFGSGKNCVYRMISLLPEPHGVGTRKNEEKRKYVLENLKSIQYRTVAFSNESAMKEFEKKLKNSTQHLFGT